MPALLRWGRGLWGLVLRPCSPPPPQVKCWEPGPMPAPALAGPAVLCACCRTVPMGQGRGSRLPEGRPTNTVPTAPSSSAHPTHPPPAPFPVSFLLSQAVTLGVGARPSPAPGRWTGHDTDSPSSSFSDTWWQRTCRPRPSFSRGQDPRAARPPGLLASADGGLRVTASPGR